MPWISFTILKQSQTLAAELVFNIISTIIIYNLKNSSALFRQMSFL